MVTCGKGEGGEGEEVEEGRKINDLHLPCGSY